MTQSFLGVLGLQPDPWFIGITRIEPEVIKRVLVRFEGSTNRRGGNSEIALGHFARFAGIPKKRENPKILFQLNAIYWTKLRGACYSNTSQLAIWGHAGPQPTDTTTPVFMASSLSVVNVIVSVPSRFE